jgi:hypothetical protein
VHLQAFFDGGFNVLPPILHDLGIRPDIPVQALAKRASGNGQMSAYFQA